MLAAAAACSSSRLSIPTASRVIGRPHLSSQSGSTPHECEHNLSHHRPRFAQSSIGSASVRADVYPPAPVTVRSSSKRDKAKRHENLHDGFGTHTNGSDCHDLPGGPSDIMPPVAPSRWHHRALQGLPHRSAAEAQYHSCRITSGPSPQVLSLDLGLGLLEGVGLAAVRRDAGSVCKNHSHFGSPFMISG
jgi:hypothetical protein